MNNMAIVAIAYNRTKSLERLLYSLNEVAYNETIEVPLIISIDWSEKIDSVYEAADRFEWKHGPKRIIRHENNLGLKKHVLFCGDMTEEYDAIAVFEDDIYASPGFYQFGQKALDYYKHSDNITGISLYTPEWNQTAGRFFSVVQNEYDTFFMQYAQSWGQIWTRNWWSEFKQWLEEENDNDFKKESIPHNVKEWPDKSSWLKQHIKFCIEKNKYFVYSKISYSTNFSEAGEHNKLTTPSYQVPFFKGHKFDYNFQPVKENAVKYDAFFEREDLAQYLNLESEDLCVDLYGTKSNAKRYLLTTRILDYKIINSFGMKLRPQELNVIMKIEGKEIHLYDTHEKIESSADKKKKENYINIYRTLYDVRATTRRNLSLLNFHLLKSDILRKTKLFKRR
ncbi:glycosyltransferase family A protein [Peribacillus frigoritolerans]|uniref:glycosyltransferase family A protein n=1 Tax=Peribacillus frigoritolerans TaxID=450367 RepID=UPI0037FF9A62